MTALLIRIAAFVIHPPIFDGDQLLYRNLARSLASGAGFAVDGVPETGVHPLLPVLMAVASYVIPDRLPAGVIVALVIGALVPALAAWLIGSKFGIRAGLVTGAMLALQPHNVLASGRLEPDLLAVALGFLLCAALVSGGYGWAGVVIALGYLNRPEALVWLPAAVVWARWRGAAWRSLMPMVLITLTLVAPFVLFIRCVEGRWALSGKDRWTYMLGVHQYRSGNQPLERERIPGMMRDVGSPLDHMRTHPQELVRGYVYRAWLLIRNVGRQTGYGLLVPFAVFGFALGLRRARDATLALLVPLATVPLLPLVVTFFRHSQIPAAVILALAGVGIAEVIDRRRTVRAAALRS